MFTFVFLIGMIFIIIGIVKNRNGAYLKKSFFSLIVLSILAAILFVSFQINISYGTSVIGLTFFVIPADKIYILLNISLFVAFCSLIAYLYSDYQS